MDTEVMCEGTVKITAIESFNDYLDKMLIEMNLKLIKRKKPAMTAHAQIDYEESELNRIFIDDQGTEYVIRTWDIIGIKDNEVKVRYTLFKYND